MAMAAIITSWGVRSSLTGDRAPGRSESDELLDTTITE